MAKKRQRRDPEKERFWRRTSQRHQQSGLTVSAFCAAEGQPDTRSESTERQRSAVDHQCGELQCGGEPDSGRGRAIQRSGW
jgi:hypothetical protein